MSQKNDSENNTVEKKYILREYEKLPEARSSILSQMLAIRGLFEKEKINSFLNPEYEKLGDPFLLNDMKKSIKRIIKAMLVGERITIYADYDADGVPGAAMLTRVFERIGYTTFDVYIPDRHREGFGLHIDALRKIHESGTTLVITIDLGTVYDEALKWSKDHGMDVIVTDHHEPNEVLSPDAYAIVNPKVGKKYPDRMLCGNATAFQLARALLEHLRHENLNENLDVPQEGWEKWLLDLVGLSTIADMVPLVGENRIFAFWGMQVLNKTRNLGIRSLSNKLRLPLGKMNEEDIAFGIVPHINAASRLASPMRAYELLAAQTPATAEVAAKELARLNRLRKSLVAKTMKEVHGRLRERDIGDVVLIGDPEWNHGILGLLASKIVDTYGVSAFVWNRHGDLIKGSCRSIKGASVLELMRNLPAGTLLQFGGHEGAGGFSCDADMIHDLEKHFNEAYRKIHEKNSDKEKESTDIVVDSLIEGKEVSWDLYREVRSCGPFGMANPRPRFAVNAYVESVEHFGKEKNHLAVIIKTGEYKNVRCRKFFSVSKEMTHEPVIGDTVTIIGNITRSAFLGKINLEFDIEDVLVGGYFGED